MIKTIELQDRVKTFETQLQHFMTMILLSDNQLNYWANRITQYRALQMDGVIVSPQRQFVSVHPIHIYLLICIHIQVCSDKSNDKIDMMEDYIINHRLILQDMTEKIIYARKILFSQQRGLAVSSCP